MSTAVGTLFSVGVRNGYVNSKAVIHGLFMYKTEREEGFFGHKKSFL